MNYKKLPLHILGVAITGLSMFSITDYLYDKSISGIDNFNHSSLFMNLLFFWFASLLLRA